MINYLQTKVAVHISAIIIFIGAVMSFYAQFQSLIPQQDAQYVAAAFVIIGALKAFLCSVVSAIKSLPVPTSTNSKVH